MEQLAKSVILREVSQALDEGKNFEIECEMKKTKKVVKIKGSFVERETFVDERGVKWVRA